MVCRCNKRRSYLSFSKAVYQVCMKQALGPAVIPSDDDNDYKVGSANQFTSVFDVMMVI